MASRSRAARGCSTRRLTARYSAGRSLGSIVLACRWVRARWVSTSLSAVMLPGQLGPTTVDGANVATTVAGARDHGCKQGGQ